METAYIVTKILHIAAGTLALLSGLGAILLRNRVKQHRPMGRIYFWSMTVIFVTSLLMAAWRFNPFLLFIAIFTYHSTYTAYRSLKLKQLHRGQKPQRSDWGVEVLNVATNAGLALFGAYLATGPNVQIGIVSMVFGLIGLRNSYGNIKRLRGRVRGSNYWLLAHIGGMLGSYIGAITAFTVNNNRWLHLPETVVWLGPTLVLVPFMVYQIARFKNAKALPV